MGKRWPKPPNPEDLFTRCLLIYGPPPKQGWRYGASVVAENIYIYPRSKETIKYRDDIVAFFLPYVEEYHTTYVFNRKRDLAHNWAHAYLKWCKAGSELLNGLSK